MPTCKGCGQSIIWIKTIAGKNHPVNAMPKKLWIDGDDIGLPGGGWSVEKCYESHFATCPAADKFRKDRTS